MRRGLFGKMKGREWCKLGGRVIVTINIGKIVIFGCRIIITIVTIGDEVIVTISFLITKSSHS